MQFMFTIRATFSLQNYSSKTCTVTVLIILRSRIYNSNENIAEMTAQ